MQGLNTKNFKELLMKQSMLTALSTLLLTTLLASPAYAEDAKLVDMNRSSIHDIIIDAHRAKGLDVRFLVPDQELRARELKTEAEYAERRAHAEEVSARRQEMLRDMRKPFDADYGFFKKWVFNPSLQSESERHAQGLYAADDIEYDGHVTDLEYRNSIAEVRERNTPMANSMEVANEEVIRLSGNPVADEKILIAMWKKGAKFMKGGILPAAVSAAAVAAMIPKESMAKEPQGAGLKIQDTSIGVSN